MEMRGKTAKVNSGIFTLKVKPDGASVGNLIQNIKGVSAGINSMISKINNAPKRKR